MNIFGFRPFKGRFNLGNSDDIPTNNDGTLIGAIKQINTHLTASNDAPFRFGYDSVTDKYGYIVDEGGADTFIPFKSGGGEPTLIGSSDSRAQRTFDCRSIPNYQDLTVDNFFLDATSTVGVIDSSATAGSVNQAIPITKSYNPSTGILTVSKSFFSVVNFTQMAYWCSVYVTYKVYCNG